jgi:hypothetical protein
VKVLSSIIQVNADLVDDNALKNPVAIALSNSSIENIYCIDFTNFGLDDEVEAILDLEVEFESTNSMQDTVDLVNRELAAMFDALKIENYDGDHVIDITFKPKETTGEVKVNFM